MAGNHSIGAVLDALLQQTKRRGGSPSVDEIADAKMALAGFITAYQAVRESAGQAGMSQELAEAIASADKALELVLGTGPRKTTVVGEAWPEVSLPRHYSNED